MPNVDIQAQVEHLLRPRPPLYQVVQPWPDPVNGEELLTSIYNILFDHIVCDDEVILAATLWCAMTWFIEDINYAPIAVITAPEKRCGKSQMLNLMGRFSKRPLSVSHISAAALYRVVDYDTPTLLIDEADTFLSRNHDLRGILNSGYARASAFVMRSSGNGRPEMYSTWGAKAICGIGNMPGTIMDRAIVLSLKRKLPSDRIKKVRTARPSLFGDVVSKLARWSGDHGGDIRTARPTTISTMDDREQDNWEPLFAIADLAGDRWSVDARESAKKLSALRAEDTASVGVDLLIDIKDAFSMAKVDRLSTQELVNILCLSEVHNWKRCDKGGPLTPRHLASLLKPYQISPISIRTANGSTAKGYHISKFADAWTRYVR